MLLFDNMSIRLMQCMVNSTVLHVEALEERGVLGPACFRCSNIVLSALALVYVYHGLFFILLLHLGERHLAHTLRQVAL